MREYFLVFVSTILVNNFVLVKFLGLCPFLGVSKKVGPALGMALATTFVMTLSAALSSLLNEYLLIPLNIEYTRTIVFIVVIAGAVQFTEMVIRKSNPVLYQLLGIYLPLITTNCAVLGMALLSSQHQYGFLRSIVHGLGAALGFSLVLVLFAGLRERIDVSDVPEPFQGAPIALISAGIMSMAFMGFSGLIRGE